MSVPLKIFKVTSNPSVWASDAIYFVADGATVAQMYVTNNAGIPINPVSSSAVSEIFNTLISSVNASLDANTADIASINTLLGSNDISLDSVQEIVDFIKDNQLDISNLQVSSIIGLQSELDLKADISIIPETTPYNPTVSASDSGTSIDSTKFTFCQGPGGYVKIKGRISYSYSTIPVSGESFIVSLPINKTFDNESDIIGTGMLSIPSSIQSGPGAISIAAAVASASIVINAYHPSATSGLTIQFEAEYKV